MTDKVSVALLISVWLSGLVFTLMFGMHIRDIFLSGHLGFGLKPDKVKSKQRNAKRMTLGKSDSDKSGSYSRNLHQPCEDPHASRKATIVASQGDLNHRSSPKTVGQEMRNYNTNNREVSLLNIIYRLATERDVLSMHKQQHSHSTNGGLLSVDMLPRTREINLCIERCCTAMRELKVLLDDVLYHFYDKRRLYTEDVMQCCTVMLRHDAFRLIKSLEGYDQRLLRDGQSITEKIAINAYEDINSVVELTFVPLFRVSGPNHLGHLINAKTAQSLDSLGAAHLEQRG